MKDALIKEPNIIKIAMIMRMCGDNRIIVKIVTFFTALFVACLIINNSFAENKKEVIMPMTPSEQLAYSTVRIEVIHSDGTTGTGTGFIFRFLDDGKTYVPAIVTNKHVIKNAIKGKFHMTLADGNNNPKIGSYISLEFDNFESRWMPHPEPNIDLTIMPIAPLLTEANQKNIKLYFIALDKSLIPSESDLSNLTAVEEILMIGYPIGIWDVTNNYPVFRRGITATHPAIKYNGKDEFLIDAACFPGSSGSPVMLFNWGNFISKEGTTVIGTRIKLLGILYAGPQYTTTGEIVIVDIPTKNIPVAKLMIPTNLGIVIRSNKLLDFDHILKNMLNQK